MIAFTKQIKSRRAFWAWAIYWCALFVATHVPVSGIGAPAVAHFDKLIHFGVYFVLVWLGRRYFALAGRPMSGIRNWRWVAIYLIFAALDEWLQGFVSRTPSVLDWVADSAGITLATLIGRKKASTSKLSEPPPQSL